MERGEQARQLVRRNPNTGVADLDRDRIRRSRPAFDAGRKRNLPELVNFRAFEIRFNITCRSRVSSPATHAGNSGPDCTQAQILFCGHGAKQPDAFFQGTAEVEGRDLQFQFSGFHFGEIQDVVNHPQQRIPEERIMRTISSASAGTGMAPAACSTR